MKAPKGTFSWLLSALVFIPPAGNAIVRIFRNWAKLFLNYAGKVLSILL